MRVTGTAMLTAAVLAALVIGLSGVMGRSGQEQRMDGIRISGPAEFQERTREALDLLGIGWHRFVTTWLKAIVYDREGAPRTGNPYIDRSATVHATHGMAFGYDARGDAASSVVWYACGLVHEAQHAYQLKNSRLSYGRESEYEAITVEVECMKDLGARSYQLAFMKQLRECIYDNGCKYWESRNW